jgi:hypothetical protein
MFGEPFKDRHQVPSNTLGGLFKISVSRQNMSTDSQAKLTGGPATMGGTPFTWVRIVEPPDRDLKP